ncbi:methylmalonyl-CoA mutase-interacting GTPase YgfD [Azospirillaceae bacterium]
MTSSIILDMAAAIRRGERRPLARAITLVESTRLDHRAQAEALLAELLPDTGRAVRIGVSGVPGVGKSTFIEAFGMHVIREGLRVAVLAVDPTSQRTGGSILGDKTRMTELTRDESAFIRPSPAGATLGGVARRTREAMLLCEAAGYNVVIIETVGVGQSETAVSDMTDLFLLLLLPGGGDELQGIKKGIVELADLVVVNKADGDMEMAARRAAAEYRHALDLLRPAAPEWKPPVLRCSALTGMGVDEVWRTILRYRETLEASGGLARRRAEQARAWLWSEIHESLMFAFHHHAGVCGALSDVEAQVASGTMIPTTAARLLLERFRGV